MNDPVENTTEAVENRCRLNAAEIELILPVKELGFADTTELEALTGLVAHPRALEALDPGVGIAHRNYHMYAAGLAGTGKLDLLRTALEKCLDGKRVPSDWVYVNNFSEPDRLLAIELAGGHAIEFRDALQDLVQKLAEAIPRAFREEAEAIELLTGIPAGDTETDGTFHSAVADRLAVMIDVLKEQPFQTAPLIWTPDMPILPDDPRPPCRTTFDAGIIATFDDESETHSAYRTISDSEATKEHWR